jgi:hypothetical protein
MPAPVWILRSDQQVRPPSENTWRERRCTSCGIPLADTAVAIDSIGPPFVLTDGLATVANHPDRNGKDLSEICGCSLVERGVMSADSNGPAKAVDGVAFDDFYEPGAGAGRRIRRPPAASTVAPPRRGI